MLVGLLDSRAIVEGASRCRIMDGSPEHVRQPPNLSIGQEESKREVRLAANALVRQIHLSTVNLLHPTTLLEKPLPCLHCGKKESACRTVSMECTATHQYALL